MKALLFTVVPLLACVLIFVPSARACDGAEEKVSLPEIKDGQLQFKTDGDDLLVSMCLTINGSGHAAITDAQVNPSTHEVTLNYTVIQNSERLMRCQKRIVLSWRLANVTKEGFTFRPVGSVMMLKAARIKELAGTLDGLADVLEQR